MHPRFLAFTAVLFSNILSPAHIHLQTGFSTDITTPTRLGPVLPSLFISKKSFLKENILDLGHISICAENDQEYIGVLLSVVSPSDNVRALVATGWYFKMLGIENERWSLRLLGGLVVTGVPSELLQLEDRRQVFVEAWKSDMMALGSTFDIRYTSWTLQQALYTATQGLLEGIPLISADLAYGVYTASSYLTESWEKKRMRIRAIKKQIQDKWGEVSGVVKAVKSQFKNPLTNNQRCYVLTPFLRFQGRYGNIRIMVDLESASYIKEDFLSDKSSKVNKIPIALSLLRVGLTAQIDRFLIS